VSVDTLCPKALRKIWTQFEAFSGKPGAGLSLVNIQAYSNDKIRSVPLEATSVGPALRKKTFHSFICTAYTDPELNEEARQLGDTFRSEMAQADGTERLVYPNFACGDETLTQLWGDESHIQKLQSLKKKYDPGNVFSQFLPLE
jgi:hypothetical protein